MAFQQPDPPSPLTLESEKKLVAQSQQGDQDAFTTLYRNYVQAIYRYCFFRVQDSDQAEDLTADVFLKAVDGLPHYNERGLPFGAWLFRIAHDRVVDFYRKTGRHPVVELKDDFISDDLAPEVSIEITESHDRLYEAISHLTDEQQAVIQFRFMENWSLEDTGYMMNKTANAVKALQHRALQSLQRYFSQRNVGGSDAHP
ncbi:MAG: sigma-70 family RNA polymerase sigma factor [Chloroflexi bacterium]|nr:sigma-70 family RNA polymerase sigma factor [Chloroflexota bacterium]MBI5081385.1 sigma-70 family RNA polymerase sigma factor [Chloroflexota bacterium]MBI5350681.1 sigma-70 family RNA polymerase sigma factor [Chloroflexota bacterium]MBI5712789.1 sigma-70 family RNA polymerase sigma factor [Chloroflexota bacterium]